jgi:hypothetical protein
MSMRSHDPKCRELAEYFLPSEASERLKAQLAQAIQDAVEEWALAEKAELEAALARRGNPN